MDGLSLSLKNNLEIHQSYKWKKKQIFKIYNYKWHTGVIVVSLLTIDFFFFIKWHFTWWFSSNVNQSWLLNGLYIIDTNNYWPVGLVNKSCGSVLMISDSESEISEPSSNPSLDSLHSLCTIFRKGIELNSFSFLVMSKYQISWSSLAFLRAIYHGNLIIGQGSSFAARTM